MDDASSEHRQAKKPGGSGGRNESMEAYIPPRPDLVISSHPGGIRSDRPRTSTLTTEDDDITTDCDSSPSTPTQDRPSIFKVRPHASIRSNRPRTSTLTTEDEDITTDCDSSPSTPTQDRPFIFKVRPHASIRSDRPRTSSLTTEDDDITTDCDSSPSTPTQDRPSIFKVRPHASIRSDRPRTSTLTTEDDDITTDCDSPPSTPTQDRPSIFKVRPHASIRSDRPRTSTLTTEDDDITTDCDSSPSTPTQDRPSIFKVRPHASIRSDRPRTSTLTTEDDDITTDCNSPPFTPTQDRPSIFKVRPHASIRSDRPRTSTLTTEDDDITTDCDSSPSTPTQDRPSIFKVRPHASIRSDRPRTSTLTTEDDDITTDCDSSPSTPTQDRPSIFKMVKLKKRHRGEREPLLNSGGAGTSLVDAYQNASTPLNNFPEDPHFQELIRSAEEAIEQEIYPDRIVQGSSGSYFVKNPAGEKIGVFKPKDEEPYGHLNPKWLKWMHKVFCPCCFGRSCLVPNQGYLSEAAASLVDSKLQLNVVPKTRVVRLSAPTFNYTPEQKAKARLKERIVSRFPGAARKLNIHSQLPNKYGSFQTFVNGYRDAEMWLRRWETNPEEAPPEAVKQDFQLQFERMVVLDYIIRNTDRGNDNWLIRYEFPEPTPAREESPLIQLNSNPASPERSGAEAEAEEEWHEVSLPDLKVAAIDNGLAFPFKHPDEWRAYPYYWAWLPFARTPFSEETVSTVLSAIDDADFVADLCDDLRKLFRSDPGYDKKMVEDQLSVMRGQIFNLREALRSRKSPVALVQMPPQLMVEVKRKRRRRTPGVTTPDGPQRPRTQWHEKYRQKVQTSGPFFSWC